MRQKLRGEVVRFESGTKGRKTGIRRRPAIVMQIGDDNLVAQSGKWSARLNIGDVIEFRAKVAGGALIRPFCVTTIAKSFLQAAE